MVKEVLDRMPNAVSKQIKLYRKEFRQYKNVYSRTTETATLTSGYVHGLKDAGIITETECNALYLYVVD